MATALDHLVVAGTDLSAVVAWWASVSGHQPTAGGAHPGRGTRNALVGLGPAYLELIGPDPDQPTPTSPRPFGIDDLPEHSIRLVTLALSVDDLDQACRIMADHDIGFTAPQPMSRARPDGAVLSWRLAFPYGFDGVLPFLIQWEDQAQHPALDLPAGCTLDSVVGRQPEADRLSPALASIEAPYQLEPADRPGLSAVVATPGGAVEL